MPSPRSAGARGPRTVSRYQRHRPCADRRHGAGRPRGGVKRRPAAARVGRSAAHRGERAAVRGARSRRCACRKRRGRTASRSECTERSRRQLQSHTIWLVDRWSRSVSPIHKCRNCVYMLQLSHAARPRSAWCHPFVASHSRSRCRGGRHPRSSGNECTVRPMSALRPIVAPTAQSLPTPPCGPADGGSVPCISSSRCGGSAVRPPTVPVGSLRSGWRISLPTTPAPRRS